jgi:hypothetical protein
MSDPLATYLHDHYAGSTFAVNLLESLNEQYAEEPLGRFGEALLAEIREDQDVLRELIERVGAPQFEIKDAAAWMAEKLSQFKLSRDTGGPLGTLESLETLALGIHGKLALWNALAAISHLDERIRRLDFQSLANRASEQQARVERERLQAAQVAFQWRDSA